MTIEIKKSWTTQSGKSVEVIGKLITEKEIWLDGNTDTVPTCEMDVTVSVDGMPQFGSIRKLGSNEKAPAGFTHVIGRLALTPEKVAIIESVKADLESNPIWVEHQAQIEANLKAMAEINRSRQSHPGWSEKTQSYSYGDEEA